MPRTAKFAWDYDANGVITKFEPLGTLTRKDCDETVKALTNLKNAILAYKLTLPTNA